MLYVAVDIGCIECGEDSKMLGVFTDKAYAEKVLDVARTVQEENWHGQHSFEIFEVESINQSEGSNND